MGAKDRLLDSRRPCLGGRPIDLNATVAANIGPIVLVLIAAVVVLLLLVLWLTRQVSQLRRRVVGLTRGEDGDLGDVLGAHLEKDDGRKGNLLAKIQERLDEEISKNPRYDEA